MRATCCRHRSRTRVAVSEAPLSIADGEGPGEGFRKRRTPGLIDRGRVSPRTVRVTVVRFPADNTRGTRRGLVLCSYERTFPAKSYRFDRDLYETARSRAETPLRSACLLQLPRQLR